MSYLHDLAQQYRNDDAHADRRRDEWATVRADIGKLIKQWKDTDNPDPALAAIRRTFRDEIIRAYHAGYKRAAALAVPRGRKP